MKHECKKRERKGGFRSSRHSWENLNFWILRTNPNLGEIQTFLCKSFIQGIF